MPVDIKQVSELRQRTGVGMMDAKKALEEANGDVNKAIEILRKAGAAKAAKKAAERVAKEGLVETYIHSNGKIGTLIVLNCETDFVARSDKFRQVAKDLALHVAASSPEYLRVEDVPAEVIEKEKEIYAALMKKEGKPEAVIAKVVENKMNTFFEEKVLLKQRFVKDDTKTIEQVVSDLVNTIGEKVELSKFVRFTV